MTTQSKNLTKTKHNLVYFSYFLVPGTSIFMLNTHLVIEKPIDVTLSAT